MELKPLAAIHISFARSNLHSDETKSELPRLGIQKPHEKDSLGALNV